MAPVLERETGGDTEQNEKRSERERKCLHQGITFLDCDCLR
jgi:hypothetical protein